MAVSNSPLIASVERYFGELRRVRASGGATAERSGYVPLANLLKHGAAAFAPFAHSAARPTSARPRGRAERYTMRQRHLTEHRLFA